MKIINNIALVLFLACSLPVFAQKKLNDNFKYKVTYQLTYSLDSTKLDQKKSEYMILYLGNNLSVFLSQAKTISNNYIIKGNKGSTTPMGITDFQYEIIKNKADKKIYYTHIIGGKDYFYYLQNLNLFNWQLKSETKNVLGYKAQQATTSFSGRDYIAWFTSEIPIPDGPYKFNGLPGLILELYDTQNHYHFTLHSFETLRESIPYTINLNNYIAVDESKLLKMYLRYKKDPFTYVGNSNTKISPEVHKKYVEMFKEKLEKENNVIEKNSLYDEKNNPKKI